MIAHQCIWLVNDHMTNSLGFVWKRKERKEGENVYNTGKRK